MTDKMMELRACFPADEIEWRVQSSGISKEKPWAMVLAYVQARAIQNRLDSVFGFENWWMSYHDMKSGLMCRLSVKIGDYIVTKEDGSPETDIEAFKGGISGALKRVAASGYGIGRYLYKLETNFAECQIEKPSNTAGWHKDKTKDGKYFWWKTPELPAWALPPSKTKKQEE